MTTDMTEGKIIPQLTGFTVPLILGNLFQLTYNAADSVIVGKFVGDDALAAVGTAGPVMNMVILFISGMCMGAGILMSTQYGAKKYAQLERQVSTAMIGGLGFSAAVTVLLLVFAHPLLVLLQVPQDIIGSAAVYLRIIFGGLIFTFIYNFFSNTLRALGDSRAPLIFLIISAALNVVLDLFFVLALEWGVPGSALATVLSEALCCLFCLGYIKKKVPLLCLGKKWKVFDRAVLGRTFSYGITSALQQMCVQLGKICVQTIVNVQGVAFIAAFTAINRVDDFAMTPQQNIAHASTTFMAQNRGAGKIRRMKQGFYCTILLETIYTAVVLALVFLFSRQIMELFVGNDSEEVVTLGISYLELIAFMYVMPEATNIIQGFFRGLGDLKVTLVSTILNMSSRFLSAWVMIHIMHGGFDRLAWANFFGWVAMLAFQIPMIVCRWKKVFSEEENHS
ncbi:MAG TPA: MATE family efflux transporter [Candidatus Mediterraneibacter tabaqchaliae]|uniref:Probable multidrug resistance protein NorM n=1 Tax=Candidatus Mediterraneibacter tabaqchaliae TaxID=2838689 RepID=A0A9D2R3N2_9FIRM|nr:MATE family efflux transporter [Candidatus Mediterraneibacter tabaqchaliae]